MISRSSHAGQRTVYWMPSSEKKLTAVSLPATATSLAALRTSMRAPMVLESVVKAATGMAWLWSGFIAAVKQRCEERGEERGRKSRQLQPLIRRTRPTCRHREGDAIEIGTSLGGEHATAADGAVGRHAALGGLQATNSTSGAPGKANPSRAAGRLPPSLARA